MTPAKILAFPTGPDPRFVEGGRAEIARILRAGRTGWDAVRESSAIQIETTLATPDAYKAHVMGGIFPYESRQLSWGYYAAWIRDNPGKAVPPEINRVREDPKFRRWAEAGYPHDIEEIRRIEGSFYRHRTNPKIREI